ncbi:MAG: apolipoprotein N-acyltransferase [Gammaproteobacteria bacterium]|nr:apolipoprotein N-acyltransferase [Gammaproteobacteria bacterium]
MNSVLGAPRTLPLVAMLLGAASVLGFAPFVWFPLPILSLALLFSLLRDASPRQAFTTGWSYGLGLFLVGVSWINVSLSTYGGMPAALSLLATLLFCAAIALFPAFGLWLAARLTGPGWVRMAIALPAGWALLEWTRGWLFTGFPWLALGYSQAPHSPLLGYAPLFGVYGVGLLAALSAGALATPRLRALMLLAVIWLGGWALNGIQWTRPSGEPIKVALVQGNVAQEMKFRPEKLQQTLLDYGRAVLSSDAQLIVLPETALPVLRSQLAPDYLEMLGEHARHNGGDVVLGVPESESGERYYNSVISVGSSPEGRYRKAHLVPFGEFLPPGFAWVLQVLSIPMSDFSRGAVDQPPLAAAGQMLAVNICYEDAFGEERIAAARASTLLVNVSNDAWFGESLAPRQHLQIGAMRSLEAGRWQLRANNTGYTAIIDDRGRVRNLLTPFTSDTLEDKVQGMTGVTPYLRWGNWPTLGAILLLLGLAWRWGGRSP